MPRLGLVSRLALVIAGLALGLALPRLSSAQTPPTVQAWGGTATVTPNSSGNTVVFTIVNNDDYRQRFPFFCTTTGQVSGCTTPTATTYIDGYASVDVTVTYNAGAAGTGTVSLTASGQGGDDTGTYTITVALPAAPAIAITPKGTAVSVAVNAAGLTYPFKVKNTGDASGSFTLSCATALPVSNCTPPASPVTINAGDSLTVTLTYATGAAGANGALTLRGSVGALSDSGYIVVTATAPAPAIAITPKGTAVSVTASTAGLTYPFKVKNTGNASGSFALSCAVIAPVSSCTPPASPQTINAGDSLTVTLTYATGAVGSGGMLILRGSVGALSDSGYIAVTTTPVPAVAISPDGAGVATTKNSVGLKYPFKVRNSGGASGTIAVSIGACLAPAITCSVSPTSVTLNAGDSATVTATYSTNATVGSNGQVKVHGAVAGSVDDGYITVTSGNAPPAVNGAVVERGLCLAAGAGAAAAYECGDLRIAHGFPVIRTMGQARSPTLLYNTQFAHPMVRLGTNVTLPASSLPNQIQVTVVVNSVNYTQLWSNPGDWTLGAVRHLTMTIDALTAALATGVYNYTMQVTWLYSGSSTAGPFSSGQFAVVNRASSAFGSGWWLAGLDQLNVANKVWIGGDGSVRAYAATGIANQWVAARVDRPDTLLWNGTYYVQVLPHGLKVLFDAAGRHVKTVNRLGHTTSFAYDGSGRLSSITVPVPPGTTPLSYGFRYGGNGRLQYVDAPGPTGAVRTTTITAVSGPITSILDVDGTTVSFGIDGSVANRITSRTNRLGVATTFSFDGGGALTQGSTAMGPGRGPIVIKFTPAETRGLASVGPVATSLVYTTINGPRVDTTITKYWLNQFGAPTKVVNVVGDSTVLTRADARFPALVTAARAADGFTTRAGYDARGNVLADTIVNPLGDGRNAISTYQWDGRWDFVTTTTAPTGETSFTQYDSTTGNALWRQIGASDTRRVDFSYNSFALIRATQMHNAPASRDTVDYSTLGNPRFSQSPMQRAAGGTLAAVAVADAIGRDTLMQSPIDSVGAKLSVRTVYDIAGQDTLTMTIGGADTVTLRKHYSAEGQLDTLRTINSPDRAAIGVMTRTFSFDAAGRDTAEQVLGGRQVGTSYDDAGNVLNGGRKGGGAVTNTYNALNQLTRRTVAIGEIANFTYDKLGRMVTATNQVACLTRTYFPGGALKTDVARYSTVNADGGCAAHTYALSYGYDLGGRRLWMKYPSQLAPAIGQDSIAYGYDPIIGALASVRDVFGNSYTVHYDSLSRVDQITRLANQPTPVIETRSYDQDSRLIGRTGPAGGSISYDPRDKIVKAAWDTMAYDPLGHLTYSSANGSWWRHRLDGLGNRTYSTGVGSDPSHTWLSYVPGTGVLAKEVIRSTGTTVPADTTTYASDTDGALWDTWRKHFISATDWCPNTNPYCRTWEYRHTTNTYDRALRLIKTQFWLDTSWATGTQPPLYRSYTSTETYQYDPLNRRVMVRGQRGSNCSNHDHSSGCGSALTRQIWDGSDLLAEIRVNSDTTGGLTPPVESDAPGNGPLFGRVGYIHGLGIRPAAGVVQGERAHPAVYGLSRELHGGDLSGHALQSHIADLPAKRRCVGRANDVSGRATRVAWELGALAAGRVGVSIPAQSVLRSEVGPLYAGRSDRAGGRAQSLRIWWQRSGEL